MKYLIVLLLCCSCHSMNRYWVEVTTEDGKTTLVNKDKIVEVIKLDESRTKLIYVNGTEAIVMEPFKSVKKRLKNNFLYVK